MAKNTEPDWDILYRNAELQGGYFTTQQAHLAGYSSRLLNYNQGRRIERIRRGIYRLIHFPENEFADYIVDWLWSGQEAIFSYDTALFLHDLSDALPNHRTILVPISWEKRRLRTPKNLILRYGETEDPVWVDLVPVTNIFETLKACASELRYWDFFKQGLSEAYARGSLLEKHYQILKKIEVPFE